MQRYYMEPTGRGNYEVLDRERLKNDPMAITDYESALTIVEALNEHASTREYQRQVQQPGIAPEGAPRRLISFAEKLENPLPRRVP